MTDPIEGIVHNTATGQDDVVRVKLPDEPRPIVVAGWLPRATAGTTEYPSAGDTALVVESDRGRLWLICWISE